MYYQQRFLILLNAHLATALSNPKQRIKRTRVFMRNSGRGPGSSHHPAAQPINQLASPIVVADPSQYGNQSYPGEPLKIGKHDPVYIKICMGSAQIVFRTGPPGMKEYPGSRVVLKVGFLSSCYNIRAEEKKRVLSDMRMDPSWITTLHAIHQRPPTVPYQKNNWNPISDYQHVICLSVDGQISELWTPANEIQPIRRANPIPCWGNPNPSLDLSTPNPELISLSKIVDSRVYTLPPQPWCLPSRIAQGVNSDPLAFFQELVFFHFLILKGINSGLSSARGRSSSFIA